MNATDVSGDGQKKLEPQLPERCAKRIPLKQGVDQKDPTFLFKAEKQFTAPQKLRVRPLKIGLLSQKEIYRLTSKHQFSGAFCCSFQGGYSLNFIQILPFLP